MIQEPSQFRFLATVRLTPVGPATPNGLDVDVSELLSYSQENGFTRLRLKGRKTLDVRETTDRIDYLVRIVSQK